MSPKIRAFTLVELLVVVAIIVVLLAILVPSLDKAIYQTELTVCGARQKAIATSIQSYAMGNQRAYPDRDPADSAEPHTLKTPVGNPMVNPLGMDFRSTLAQYLVINAFQCPMSKEMEIEGDTTPWIWTSYDIRAGFTFKGYKGMLRVGDRWAFRDTSSNPASPRDYLFDIIASDFDVVTDVQRSASSHPDRGDNAAMVQSYYRDPLYYFSLWVTKQDGVVHDKMDLNYAFQDGSVRRFTEIKALDDDRMARVASWASGQDYDKGIYRNMPKER